MTIFAQAPGALTRRAKRIATVTLFLLALSALALADGRTFRVARISLIEGEVSYQRANDSKKDWFDATLNLPLDESDQLYSGPDGRAEIQLSGRNIVRIDRDTNLRFTQFNTGTVQMALPIGVAYFRVDSLDKRQFDVVDANDLGANDPVYFEVDTPTVAVTFAKEGIYRINVRDDGSTEVIVRQGQAEVYSQEIGAVVVKKAVESSLKATTIITRSPGSKIKTIGIGGTTAAMTTCSPAPIRIAARVTCLWRFPAFTIWTLMASGTTRRITAGSGRRAESLPAGRRIVRVTGDGIRPTAGRGFRMSRGAGRRTITGDGLITATDGAGRLA